MQTDRRQFLIGGAALLAAGAVVSPDAVLAKLAEPELFIPCEIGTKWAVGTCYVLGDIVRINGKKFYVCTMTGTGKTAKFEEVPDAH